MIQTEIPLSTLVSEFAKKTGERRKLEAKLKKLATDLAAREEKLVEGFAQAGIQNIKTATGETVYLNREVFAKLTGDPEKAYAAFRNEGLDDFVKESVNSQTLRAWVREMDEVLPEGLQPYIDVTEVYRMRMRSN